MLTLREPRGELGSRNEASMRWLSPHGRDQQYRTMEETMNNEMSSMVVMPPPARPFSIFGPWRQLPRIIRWSSIIIGAYYAAPYALEVARDLIFLLCIAMLHFGGVW